MIKLIAALGNPGKEYARTRHNAAWVVLDAWAATQRAVWQREEKFEAEVARAGQLWLLKPQTYMNLSGVSVGAFMRFYKLQREEILVIHDEVAFDSGQLRLCFGGSAGGHNGVESIIQAVGGDGLWRLRLGVGPRMPNFTLRDWVLGPLGEEAEKNLKSEAALKALSAIVEQGPESAQNEINRG